MPNEGSDFGLRQALQAMTEETKGEKHPEPLRLLSLEHPNTIAIVESSYPLHRYTCFVYAFGFAEKPHYVAIARIGFNRVYASPDFAHWLIDQNHLTEITEFDLVSGDFALYSTTDGRFRHAAVFRSSDRFQSKWGLGYLFDHRLFEVPISYGNAVRFFRQISYAQAIRAFSAFAESRGMRFSTIASSDESK